MHRLFRFGLATARESAASRRDGCLAMEDIKIPNDELHLRMWADLRARDDAWIAAEEMVDEAALLHFGMGLADGNRRAADILGRKFMRRQADTSDERTATDVG